MNAFFCVMFTYEKIGLMGKMILSSHLFFTWHNVAGATLCFEYLMGFEI